MLFPEIELGLTLFRYNIPHMRGFMGAFVASPNLWVQKSLKVIFKGRDL